MITTVFHRLDTADTDWQSAHLFEHLFVTGFYRFLSDHSVSPVLFGWLSAETFESCIYIDGGFYDPYAATLMQEYISQLPDFSSGDIEHALEQMQAEEKVLLTVVDKQLLIECVKKLSKRTWDTTLEMVSGSKRLITAKRSAKEFKDIIVTVYADELTPEEQKVFLRLNVVIIDTVSSVVVTKNTAYSQGNSPVALQDSTMAYMSKFTLRRHVRAPSLASINTDIQQAIRDIGVAANMSALNKHIAVFAKEALWRAMPLEYYRNTGIVTTVSEIASLTTKERVTSILGKIRVETRLATPEDDYHIS